MQARDAHSEPLRSGPVRRQPCTLALSSAWLGHGLSELTVTASGAVSNNVQARDAHSERRVGDPDPAGSPVLWHCLA